MSNEENNIKDNPEKEDNDSKEASRKQASSAEVMKLLKKFMKKYKKALDILKDK